MNQIVHRVYAWKRDRKVLKIKAPNFRGEPRFTTKTASTAWKKEGLLFMCGRRELWDIHISRMQNEYQFSQLCMQLNNSKAISWKRQYRQWYPAGTLRETQTSTVITLEEETISVFLSLKGITESRDFFINALRNGTLKTHLWKKLILFLFLNRTLKVIYFRYFLVLTY